MRRVVILPLIPLLFACKGTEEPEEVVPPSFGSGGLVVTVGEPTPPESPGATGTEPDGRSDAAAKRMAMELWRDDDLVRHPKGSCAGCHGPDFLDLAVIGSTDADLRRRAITDGASEDEADALVQAVAAMRRDLGLPVRDPRAFRPFQPGGTVLLADLDEPQHVASVRRDIAFGRQLEALLPTLYGARIGTLEAARRARDELLDLARGTNEAGANPRLVQLRDLPTGITFPLWSADLHHGADEGTFNDWVADVAHDPVPEHRRAWLDLQDAYLREPTRERFWRMYEGAETLLETPLLAECTMTGTNAHLRCGGAADFATEKFLAALIGQHRLREAVGAEPLAEGPLAYAYLDDDPSLGFMLDRHGPSLLPAHLWEVGDRARVVLTGSPEEGSFRRDLAELGFAGFVQDSIDPDRTAKREQHALRLAWFWIGFTHDPSFARTHPSNATKVGEYMVASLAEENMFVHNSFAAHMRLVAKGTLAEANVETRPRTRGVFPTTPEFQANYSYFVAYGREVPRWREDERAGRTIPQALKDEQMDLFSSMTANGFRMALLLHEDAVVRDGVESQGVPFEPIERHFATFEPERRSEDRTLLERVQRAVEG